MTTDNRPAPSVYELICDLRRTQPRQFLVSLLLTCVLPCFSGVSMLLLIPILQSANAIGEGATSAGVGAASHRLFAALGLTRTLSVTLALFLAMTSLYALALFYQLRLNSRLKLDFILGLQEKMYRAVGQANWSFFLQTRTQDLAHVLSIETERILRGMKSLFSMTACVALTTVYVMFSFLLAPGMTTLVLLGCFVLAPLMMKYTRGARGTGVHLTVHTRRFYRDTIDHLSGIKEARSLCAESRHAEKFGSVAQLVSDTRFQFEVSKAAANLVFSIGTAIALTLTIYVAIELLKFPPVDLFLLVVIYARVTPRLLKAGNDYQEIIHALPAYGAVKDMQRKCDGFRDLVVAADDRSLPCTQGIKFCDVGFRYSQKSDVWALKNINASIPARAITAIIGHSGSGKSTFADLLLGLLSPETGVIKVDGRNIQKHLGNWRQMIGYVPQETFLLHDTLRRNLLWGNPDAGDEEIADALRLASIDDVVARLPDGLETVVGERGSRLSGGERQRVALARALLRSPSVLILDEATSALDLENTQRIESSLNRLAEELTVIVIAHARSAVRNAKHVIVLDHGHVSEQGEFEDLLRAKDLLVA